MRMLILAVLLGVAASAQAEVPPPDMAASPWLNAIRVRLFNQARSSILFTYCVTNGDVTETRQFTQVFNEEAAKLPDEDQLLAGNVFVAGQDQAAADVNDDERGVCASYGPAQAAEVRALAARRQSFWDAPR